MAEELFCENCNAFTVHTVETMVNDNGSVVFDISICQACGTQYFTP